MLTPQKNFDGYEVIYKKQLKDPNKLSVSWFGHITNYNGLINNKESCIIVVHMYYSWYNGLISGGGDGGEDMVNA